MLPLLKFGRRLHTSMSTQAAKGLCPGDWWRSEEKSFWSEAFYRKTPFKTEARGWQSRVYYLFFRSWEGANWIYLYIWIIWSYLLCGGSFILSMYKHKSRPFDLSWNVGGWVRPIDDSHLHSWLLMVQKSGDHQLRLVVYSILYIPGGAGFLAPTVS